MWIYSYSIRRAFSMKNILTTSYNEHMSKTERITQNTTHHNLWDKTCCASLWQGFRLSFKFKLRFLRYEGSFQLESDYCGHLSQHVMSQTVGIWWLYTSISKFVMGDCIEIGVRVPFTYSITTVCILSAYIQYKSMTSRLDFLACSFESIDIKIIWMDR